MGEDGPELMFFNGGEKVLNAQETTKLRSNAIPAALSSPTTNSILPPIQIAIQVEGNAAPETADALKDAAQDIAEMVTERVMDQLENRREDQRRREYS